MRSVADTLAVRPVHWADAHHAPPGEPETADLRAVTCPRCVRLTSYQFALLDLAIREFAEAIARPLEPIVRALTRALSR